MSLEQITSDPRVLETLQKVSAELGGMPYRLAEPTDFRTMPGVAAPIATSQPIYTAPGNNIWVLKESGGRWKGLVFAGWYNDGLFGNVNFLDLRLNDKVREQYPGMMIDDSSTGICLLPAGPRIIDASCEVSLNQNLAAGLNAVQDNSFPILFVFAPCG